MGLFGRNKKNDRDPASRAGQADGEEAAPDGLVGEETELAKAKPSSIQTPPPSTRATREADVVTRVRAAAQSARDESETPTKAALPTADGVEQVDDLPEAEADLETKEVREGDIETRVRSRETPPQGTPLPGAKKEKEKEDEPELHLHTLVDVVNLAAHQLDSVNARADQPMTAADPTQLTMPDGDFKEADAPEAAAEELLPFEEVPPAAEPATPEEGAAVEIYAADDEDWENAETFIAGDAPAPADAEAAQPTDSASNKPPAQADPRVTTPAESVTSEGAASTSAPEPAEEPPVLDETQPLDPRDAERILTNLLNERKAVDRGVSPTDETMQMPTVKDDTVDVPTVGPGSERPADQQKPAKPSPATASKPAKPAPAKPVPTKPASTKAASAAKPVVSAKPTPSRAAASTTPPAAPARAGRTAPPAAVSSPKPTPSAGALIPDPDAAELLDNATRVANEGATPAIVLASRAPTDDDADSNREAGGPPRMQVVHELTSDDALPRIATDSRDALPVPDADAGEAPRADAAPRDARPAAAHGHDAAAPTPSGRQRAAKSSTASRAAVTSASASASASAPASTSASTPNAAAPSTRSPARSPGTPSSRMTTPSGTPAPGGAPAPAPAPTPSQASARRRRHASSSSVPPGETPAPPPAAAAAPPPVAESVNAPPPAEPASAPGSASASAPGSASASAPGSASASAPGSASASAPGSASASAPGSASASAPGSASAAPTAPGTAADAAAKIFDAQAPAADATPVSDVSKMETAELPTFRVPVDTPREEEAALKKYPDARLVDTESGRYIVIDRKDKRSGEDTAVLPALPADAKGPAATSTASRETPGDLVVNTEGASFIVRERTTSPEELAQQIAADALEHEHRQEETTAAIEHAAKLGELLESEGVVTHDELARGLDRLAQTRTSVGRALLDANAIDRRDLWAALAARYAVPQLKLGGCKIDKQALECVPKALAIELRVVPVLLLNDVLCVATAEPYDLATVRRLREATRLRVKVLEAAESEIGAALQALYGHAANPVESIAESADAPATVPPDADADADADAAD